MKYRYERMIAGTICFIDIEWSGAVEIIGSSFGHLIGLKYPNLETFERSYPDYRMNGIASVNPASLQSISLYPNPFGHMFDDLNNLKPERINVMPVGCSHTFVPYIGMVETFEYCTKCDAKKGR